MNIKRPELSPEKTPEVRVSEVRQIAQNLKIKGMLTPQAIITGVLFSLIISDAQFSLMGLISVIITIAAFLVWIPLFWIVGPLAQAFTRQVYLEIKNKKGNKPDGR